MTKYKCSICQWVYDPEIGDSKGGIKPEIPFESLPEDWRCPLCNAPKSEFYKLESEGASGQLQDDIKVGRETVKISSPSDLSHDELRELSPSELSFICSSIALGCRRQYMDEEAALFETIAKEYLNISPTDKIDASFEHIAKLVTKSIEKSYPEAYALAEAAKDRGAKRALTWTEGATRMLSSQLKQHLESGSKNTNIYVCEACGFISIGENVPEICPVCKVGSIKFRKI